MECAAIPSELIERGRLVMLKVLFTSAVKTEQVSLKRLMAERFFLDESGDMSLSAQQTKVYVLCTRI